MLWNAEDMCEEGRKNHYQRLGSTVSERPAIVGQEKFPKGRTNWILDLGMELLKCVDKISRLIAGDGFACMV